MNTGYDYKVSFAVFASNDAAELARKLRNKSSWKVSREGNYVSIMGIIVRSNNEDDFRDALAAYQRMVVVCGGIRAAKIDHGTLDVGIAKLTVKNFPMKVIVFYTPSNAQKGQKVDAFFREGQFVGRGRLEDGDVVI